MTEVMEYRQDIWGLIQKLDNVCFDHAPGLKIFQQNENLNQDLNLEEHSHVRG